MSRVTDTSHLQPSGSHARDISHRHSGNKTVNKILSVPIKAIGVVTAGVGLILVELSTYDYAYDDHDTDRRDHNDTDVGLALTGLGLALGGGLLYELGNTIGEQ